MKTQQQINNLTLALLKWGFEVRPEKVVPGLERYTQRNSCGTLHCFGGFVCAWPEFKRQGAYMGSGMPWLRAGDVHVAGGNAVSQELFGSYGLFAARGGHVADGDDADDHTVVARRLEWELEHA